MHRCGVILCLSNEDRLFVAEVPGCIARADVQAITLRNIRGVVQLWIGRGGKLGRPAREPGGGRLVFA